jgi:hypothetical protein
LIPVGNILLGISLFFVGSKYKNARLKVGGIMTAIPFPLLGFIGLILAYSGGYSILKKYYLTQGQAGLS